MECVICFSEVDKHFIKCADKDCEAKVCIECGSNFLKYSCKENQMMMCPGSDCKSVYLNSEMKKLPNVKDYHHLFVSYLSTENMESLESVMTAKKVIEKIRAEKLAFITSNFPKAITSVINIAMQSNLKKINKNNKLKMQSVLINSRKCPNVLCTGHLDNKFNCSLCDTMYCKTCERKQTSDHQCKQEDIDSIKFVNDLVKCPKCKFPVIRSYGCNMMTCSVCRTNFDYTTGKLTQAGNHNAHETFEVKTSSSPSERYVGVYSERIFNVLLQIEKKKPLEIKVTSTLNALKRFKETPSDDLAKQVAVLYEKHFMNKIKQKHYYKCMIKIEELHNENNICVGTLTAILKSM